MKRLITAAVLTALLTVSAGVARAATCYICECNSQQNECNFSCQDYTDYVDIQQCNHDCLTTFQACQTAAYAAASAEEQSSESALTSTD